MLYSDFQNSASNSYFGIMEYYSGNGIFKRPYPSVFNIFMNHSDQDVFLIIDGIRVCLSKNEVATATYLQKIEIPFQSGLLTVFSFNREFYCLHKHEEEVSCSGIMFLGAKQTPKIKIPEDEEQIFKMLIQVFKEEMKIRDVNQESMLQMLLKRLIIKLTRYGKTQLAIENQPTHHIDLVKDFYMLVDRYYRQHHLVADYAEMLHKSPKTISNVFAKNDLNRPISIIHDRIILEAKHLLLESDLSVKEIIDKLGFSNANTFFKLFRKYYAVSPKEFKTFHKGKNGVKVGKNDYLLSSS